MGLCHVNIQKEWELLSFLSFGRSLGIGPRLDLALREDYSTEKFHMSKFPQDGRALGCCFYKIYMEKPQCAIKMTLLENILQGPFSQRWLPPRLYSWKCVFTFLKNRAVLTICSSSACKDLLVMLWVTLYTVFNDFMGSWENVQSFIVEILHFGLGTNTSNLVLYKTDWELVPHPFCFSKNYSHHNKVAVEFMIIYSKWKQSSSGIPSPVLVYFA